MNKQELSNKIKAYEKLTELEPELADALKGDDVFKRARENLEMLKVSERFGIPLTPCSSTQYYVEGGYDPWTCVRFHSGEGGLSWSDDGRQPNNEWLYIISFPTGRYIFGDGFYNTGFPDLFKLFFKELKTYNPKYVDTANNALYFTEETSESVYNNFWNILNKYRGMVADESKRLRKKELEEELAKL
jgi:hypothetical protein